MTGSAAQNRLVWWRLRRMRAPRERVVGGGSHDVNEAIAEGLQAQEQERREAQK